MCLGVTPVATPPSGADKAQAVRRAQVIARLRNPNLVRMLPLPGGAGLVPVVTDARRLSDFTFPSGTFRRFDLEQVVRLLLDVLAGLSALHEVIIDGERFVHGEVCPKHIYIGEYGTAKLVPLTSSHVGSASKLEVTGYTAPELAARRRFDTRADLYSVGVMLWEALAGERLFPENDDDVETAVAGAGPPAPRKTLKRARAAWAQPLCAIAERASAADPNARYASALELSNAIAQAIDKHLSKVNSESWQDEAPTPVFQPRLHLPPPPRAATPPATVMDVEPKPAAVPPAAMPRAAVPTTRFVSSAAFDEAETRVVRAPARARRALGMGIGSAVLLAVLAVAYTKTRPYWPTVPMQTLRNAAARAAPAAPLHIAAPTSASTNAAPPSSAVPAVTRPAASTTAATTATPADSAAAAPKASAKAKPRAQPPAQPRPARKRPSAPDKSDYGI